MWLSLFFRCIAFALIPRGLDMTQVKCGILTGKHFSKKEKSDDHFCASYYGEYDEKRKSEIGAFLTEREPVKAPQNGSKSEIHQHEGL